MSLRFRYKLIPIGHPVLPLGGRWVRPRPLVAVTVVGPASSRAKEALLDTAADDTVFSETLAVQIGLDLTNAPPGGTIGDLVLGHVVPRRPSFCHNILSVSASRQNSCPARRLR